MDTGLETLSNIIAYSKYAKYIPQLQRRETWDEIVARYQLMMNLKYPSLIPEISKHVRLIREKKVLPSMRALQFAGPAAEVNNSRIFNCAYFPIDSIYSFSEGMFLLLGGTGIGYSVQQHHVEQLPPINRADKKSRKWLIEDSIMGWADAIKVLMKYYLNGGFKPIFDFRAIRPKGARLVTAGGKAPGPEPLKICLAHIEAILERKHDGEKLSPLECHDIMCHIANSVLAGGIRRCLPYYAEVHTKTGLKQIKDVLVGDMVLTYDGYKPVLNNFYQGEQNTIIINTQLGEFECTPNHKVAVMDSLHSYKWIEAQHLSSEDRLLFIPKAIEGYSTSLPEFNYIKPNKSTTCKDIIIPELTPDVAYLFGVIFGDGYVYVNKTDKKTPTSSISRRGKINVACANNYEEIKSKVVKGFRLFGIEPVISKGDGDLEVVTVHSYQLALYFSQFKTPNTDMSIPEFIKQGTKEIRGAFLAGLLDSDGCISNRPIRLLNSIYPNFTKDVQNLYSSLGIPVRMKFSERKQKNWQPIGQLGLVGKTATERFKTFVEVFSVKKIIKDNSFGQFDYTVPFSMISGNTDRSIDRIVDDTQFLPIKVVSIEEGNLVDTYDIEVEERNEFVCEGLLVHNSAMIALFSPEDEEMMTCKYGNWWELNEQRGRSNNSVVLERGKVDRDEFDNIWKRIQASGSGEPGIYWTNDKNLGTNPCCEISLKPFQFCNLTEINVSDVKNQQDLEERVITTAFFGTLQAGFTDFYYLRDIWRTTTESEALLGIGMTGIASGAVLNLDLEKAAKLAVEVNQYISSEIGINRASRVTTIKPSGTTSLILGTSSGIHAWHNTYYLRTIRFGKNEEIATYLMNNHPEICEDDILRPVDTVCVRIPVRAPKGSILRTESVLDLLERVKKFYSNWIIPGHIEGNNTNNISATISVKPEEWKIVGEWMWNNKQFYNGLSVLPYLGGSYVQAPFEDISEEEYYNRSKVLKSIDLSKVIEIDDNVNFGQIAACAGGQCETTI